MKKRLLMNLALLFAAVVATGPAWGAPGASASDKTWIRASDRRQDFAVFTAPTQSLPNIFGSKVQAAVSGLPGTVLSTDDGKPILHSGAIRVNCAKGAASISARAMLTSVEDSGQAIIESVPSTNSFRVINLGKGVVSVRLRKSHAAQIVPENQQLVIRNVDKQLEPFVAEDKDSITPLAKTAPLQNVEPIRLKAVSGSEFRCDSTGRISLRHGEALLACSEGATVSNGQVDVVAKRSALLDVENYAGELRVKALSGPGHISINRAEQAVSVEPGQEVFAAAHSIEEKDMLPADGVGRRRQEKVSWPDGFNLVLSDFSVPSFLTVSEHMQSVKRETTPADRRMWERILKTCAAVQVVSTKSGPYKSAARAARPKRNVRNAGTGI